MCGGAVRLVLSAAHNAQSIDAALERIDTVLPRNRAVSGVRRRRDRLAGVGQ
jgi:hypothetical protein